MMNDVMIIYSETLLNLVIVISPSPILGESARATWLQIICVPLVLRSYDFFRLFASLLVHLSVVERAALLDAQLLLA